MPKLLHFFGRSLPKTAGTAALLLGALTATALALRQGPRSWVSVACNMTLLRSGEPKRQRARSITSRRTDALETT